MSHYFHHVPGRIRIRSRQFRANLARARELETQLRQIEGVHDVRVNERNGSLTIQYEAAGETGNRLVGLLADAGFTPNGGASPTKSAAGGDDLVATFSRAVVGAVAQQTVTRSLSTLALMFR
jgi:copper chaperone CopZ